MTELAAPLKSLKVVDLTQGLAGPYCAMLLAHHGADVVKIEPPNGDWSRTLGVPRGGMTSGFIACNRGKRGIVLDLKQPSHVQAVHTLAAQADVVLESNRAGVADRLGVGFETLHAINPDLIYLSVTGFGQTGPYRDRPVTDAIMQAFSGFMTRNPDADGLPSRIEFAVPDYTTGLMAYQAVSTALLGRAFGQHRGRHVDVSLMSAMLAYQQANIIDWEFGNHVVKNPLPPTGTYRTQDGLINISIVREKYFVGLCEVLGLDALPNDPRFSSTEARREHETALRELLEPTIAARATAPLAEALREQDVPSCPVNRYDQVVRDEHVNAVGNVAWANQPAAGDYPLFGVPGSSLPPEAARVRQAPSLGEHTAEVLSEYDIALD